MVIEPIKTPSIQYPQAGSRQKTTARHLRKQFSEEIFSYNIRFNVPLVSFRGNFPVVLSEPFTSASSQSRAVDVSNDTNWANLISGV
jgi:hypothetical protein